MVQGPDGAPYVIDRTTKTVYRVDLKRKKATVVAARRAEGRRARRSRRRRFLAVGGLDLLILDSKNVLWRWRPSNATGKGTLDQGQGQRVGLVGRRRGRASGRTSRTRAAASTTCTSSTRPSSRSGPTRRPSTAAGSRPASTGWLATARPVDGMTALYIDGDLFVTEDGASSGSLGQERRLEGRGPRGRAPAARRRRTASSAAAPTGAPASSTPTTSRTRRIVAIDKANGDYKGQYRLAGGVDGWDDLRGCRGHRRAPRTRRPTVLWLSKDGVHQAVARGRPRRGAGRARRRRPRRRASPRPSVTPKPTKKP